MRAEPTQAQKEAGNYKKDHIRIHGLDIAIENPRGSMRRGVGKDGEPWQVRMPNAYGYIKRTEGADGDHVDCYIGPHVKSPRVYVIDQVEHDNKRFDEHKCMIGFASKQQAVNAYKKGFSDGKGHARIGAVKELTVEDFKRWLSDGGTIKRIAKHASGGRVAYADGGTIPDWASAETAPDWAGENAMPDERNPFYAAVADVPSEIKKSAAENWNAIKEGFFPEGGKGSQGVIEGTLATGRGLAAIPGLAFSPVTGAARSLIGHPYSTILPGPEGETREQAYQRAKDAVDTAMSAAAPGRGGLHGPVPMPARPPTGPLGVTLTEGQEGANLPLIQREQAALRGQLGGGPQARAQEFRDQQAAQLGTAREGVARALDDVNSPGSAVFSTTPGAGQVIAETPQEAGALVSQSMQNAAASRKAGVTQAYNQAKALPGEIDANVFRQAGDDIKADLSSRAEPIIVDDKLTPFASLAVRDLDNRVSQLFIQNRADPLGPPNPNTIIGVDLKGIEQWRKRLSTFRQQAYQSGNTTDGRAAKAVLDAFDKRVDAAVNGGQFRGDPRAIQAWNDARAAHADFRSTFGAGKNDPIGRVVEKILGRNNNPAAIPNDVADFIYGSSGVNPGSLNVGVANRIKGVLGDQSPEWAGVRQGLFSRLVEPTPGMTDFGPGKIAQRLNRFLAGDGRELAETIFTPAQRQLLQQYADLHRRLEVPQAGANWSNTGTTLNWTLDRLQGLIGMALGAGAAHAAGLPFGLAEAAGYASAKTAGALRSAIETRRIAKQMPLVTRAMQQWQKAAARATQQNTPLSSTALRIAGANLTRSLAPLGIDLKSLGQIQGPVPARAEDEQQ